MKKMILSLGMAVVSLTFLPVQTFGVTPEKPEMTVPAPKTAGEEEAGVLISRLNEINLMDKTNLNFAEKKDLRNEVKAIEAKLKDIGGGVYISSAAALVIIVLLLILLL